MYKGTLNASKLYLGLQKQAQISEKKLHKRHPHVVSFFEKRGLTPAKLREHAGRVAAASAMAGAMLLSQPVMQQVVSSDIQHAKMTSDELQKQLTGKLSSLIPQTVRPLSQDEETHIQEEIKIIWGIDAKATLEGEHLNTSYGYMGAEQHLMRYPGDAVPNMAPGKGAWGYFAPSRSDLTQDLIEKEKWYVAVQTLYLPDWNTRLTFLRDWYKFRKVLVVNPANGKTVVADVADAGPASWTGKHYGGSPEVMAYLGLNVGKQKGAVVLFFVDDPGGEVPLGPVEYNVKYGKAVL